MPEYAEIAREHAQRVGGPGFISRPGEKTYSIYPEGLGGKEYEYWPTETAGQPDLRSITIPQSGAGWTDMPEIEIEDMPQQDYELGNLVIENKYMEQMKTIDALWPDRTQPPPQQYLALSEIYKRNLDTGTSKLQMKLDRAEMTFKQIRQDPNFSQEEQFEAKSSFYKSNPVWQAPRERYPRAEKPLTFEQQLEAGLTAGMEEPGAPIAEKPGKTWGLPTLTKPGYRVRPERPVAEQPTQEPLTQEVFENTVARLKATNMAQAREYYDRWANKW